MTVEPAEPNALIEETCPGCGQRFTCCPAGKCWCGQQPFRLPLPASSSHAVCYCPSCLPKVAEGMLRRRKP